jgi:hypothetical protein
MYLTTQTFFRPVNELRQASSGLSGGLGLLARRPAKRGSR